MKITVVMGGARHTARRPYADAGHVEIVGLACPNGCKHDPALELADCSLKISGTGVKHRSKDTYFADAVALCCRKTVGTLETKVETLFGIEEDERVLSGPWKVF